MTGSDRERLLSDRCGADVELRADVEKLLGWDARVSTRFLEGDSCQPIEQPLPERIAHFRILRRIGEGGMGSVFEAQQDHPRRNVALKIIRVAMASESIRRRFEYEVQILGQLKHPGIAQIYEAGTHDDGNGPVPYFAMEFVQGRSLIDFARHHKLANLDRLSLMAEICDAVHHAHQKGVVHRDLKPANILIEFDGGTPQPKILDFGVARATHCDIHQVTMHTEVGQIVGTLSYMSPEQVAGRPDELDVRSDVYALGVILFELLADRLPYDLRGHSIPEAGSIIQEQEPSRLSTIHSAFRGDIETIAAKALEKEKERRYQSAAELAEDIRRFLRDEPIVARPASRAYQIRKFAKRNKAIVGGIAAVFVTLVLGIIGTSIALVQTTRAERIALEHSDESRRSAARATAVSNFLQEMLASVDPAKAMGRETTIRQALDDASAKIESGSLKDQPEIEAELRRTIGSTYNALGLSAVAEPHLRKALELAQQVYGLSDYRYASFLGAWIEWLFVENRIDESLAATRELLELRLREFGDEHELVAEALSTLGVTLNRKGDHDAADNYSNQAVAMLRRLNATKSFLFAKVLQHRAHILYTRGDLQAAKTAYEEAVLVYEEVIGREHPQTVSALDAFALVLKDMGDFTGAEARLREVLDIRRKLFKDGHPDLSHTLNDVGLVLLESGKPEQAEPFFVESLDMRRKFLPSDHFQIGYSLNNIAKTKQELGQWTEAEELYRQAAEIIRSQFGGDYHAFGAILDNLAQVVRDEERLPEAEELARESVSIRSKALGQLHVGTASSIQTLGTILRDEGKLDEAEAMLREALNIRRKELGNGHFRVAQSCSELAIALMLRGSFEDAMSLAGEAHSIFQAKLDSHWRACQAESVLGSAMAAAGQVADGEPHLIAAAESMKTRVGTPPRRKREAIERIVLFYDQQGRTEEANKWRTSLPAHVEPASP